MHDEFSASELEQNYKTAIKLLSEHSPTGLEREAQRQYIITLKIGIGIINRLDRVIELLEQKKSL